MSTHARAHTRTHAHTDTHTHTSMETEKRFFPPVTGRALSSGFRFGFRFRVYDLGFKGLGVLSADVQGLSVILSPPPTASISIIYTHRLWLCVCMCVCVCVLVRMFVYVRVCMCVFVSAPI